MTHEVKSEPAEVSGQAGRISKVAAQPAQLHMTIEVTRAGTGRVDVFELIGVVEPPGEEQCQ